MKNLTKILVPTDLSERSRRALLYGCSLAAQDNASLLLLHVANEFNAWGFSIRGLAAGRSCCHNVAARPRPYRGQSRSSAFYRTESGCFETNRVGHQTSGVGTRRAKNCASRRRRKGRLDRHVAAAPAWTAPSLLRLDHGSGDPPESLPGTFHHSTAPF